MKASRDYPRLGFFDADLWGSTYRVLLDSFDHTDRDWRELLFRLWVARVLSYTVNEGRARLRRLHRIPAEHDRRISSRLTKERA